MLENNHHNPPAIIFDLGAVLIDWNPEYLFRKMFAGDEAEMDYFLTAVCPLEWNEQQDAGRLISEAVTERVALFPEYEPYIRAYYGRWIEMIGGAIMPTVDILAALRDKDFPLFALSNWSAETFPRVEKRYEFLSWFDDVIISGHEKMAKPDPAIYELTLRRVNRPAGQCLFIDDNKRNILVAEQLGFQTIHFTTPECLSAELHDRKLL